ncbi:ragulator complex protein LAMTOR3-A-like [Saccostrea echinata]|uniref:ragulator complex protein LAMTOR3-A-like n=1 Tax=Saccostrea echinata TaxID=191078 RepID=UPI002A827777|nr:ragulator complex protein LAMTOR3-A-like [Saccostrea echinata]
MEEAKNYLSKLSSTVDGLLAIVITDRDGIPLLKVAMDQVPEQALRHSFLSTFGTATEQANKLGLKQSKSVISMFKNYQVVQINKYPLIVTFIAESDANTGLLLNLETDMRDLLNDLQRVVPTS